MCVALLIVEIYIDNRRESIYTIIVEKNLDNEGEDRNEEPAQNR